MTPKPQPQAPNQRNEPGADAALSSAAGGNAALPSGAGGRATAPDEAFAKLRHILLAPEQQRIDTLAERLDNVGLRANELARVLPKAIVRGAQQQTGIETALQPILQDVLRSSVKRNPQVLVIVSKEHVQFEGFSGGCCSSSLREIPLAAVAPRASVCQKS